MSGEFAIIIYVTSPREIELPTFISLPSYASTHTLFLIEMPLWHTYISELERCEAAVVFPESHFSVIQGRVNKNC